MVERNSSKAILNQQEKVFAAFISYQRLHDVKPNLVIMDEGFHELEFETGYIVLPHPCEVIVVPRMGKTQFELFNVTKHYVLPVTKGNT